MASGVGSRQTAERGDARRGGVNSRMLISGCACAPISAINVTPYPAATKARFVLPPSVSYRMFGLKPA